MFALLVEAICTEQNQNQSGETNSNHVYVYIYTFYTLIHCIMTIRRFANDPFVVEVAYYPRNHL